MALAQREITEDRSLGSNRVEALGSLNGESAEFETDTALAAACRHVLATDGKQIRPSIVREAAKHGPRSGSEAVERAARAVELLHLASLTHDDVIDGGDLRRGTETARVRFGDPASVLSGGWLFASAIELLAGAGNDATGYFCAATARICEGQMLESEDIYNSDRSVARYLEAIEGKTAALFELSALLGALLSGHDEDVVERLRSYGRELGLGFQIADDILDLLADDAVTGKSRGSDVRRGVYTLPLLYALAAESGLAELLQDPEAGGARLPELTEGIERAGGFERASAECAEHLAVAKAALVGLPHERRLGAAAEAILQRCRSGASS